MTKIIQLSNYTTTAENILINDGKYSSEWFSNDILLPELNKKEYDKIIIDLSGMIKLSRNFLRSTFQNLVFNHSIDFKNVIIKCNEDLGIAADIMSYVQEAEIKIKFKK